MRGAEDATPHGRVVVMAKGLTAMGDVASDAATALALDVVAPVLALTVGVVGDGWADVPAEGAWQPVVRQIDTATAMTALVITRDRTLSDPPFTVISAGRSPQRP
ncbi:unannotated protein [freshwater metagenome]|uniref:Unannotated protein n=1 Tax=freshwater metagenome TaxID=449393 RepID=A0A6J6HQJ7_9ZZZZ